MLGGLASKRSELASRPYQDAICADQNALPRRGYQRQLLLQEEEVLRLENQRRQCSPVFDRGGLIALPAGVEFDGSDASELACEVRRELIERRAPSDGFVRLAKFRVLTVLKSAATAPRVSQRRRRVPS